MTTLWPALRALAHGSLTSDETDRLVNDLGLDASPRTSGPGKAGSIAHRAWQDPVAGRLTLDLARTGESGWVLALFFEQERPPAAVIEAHRLLFRDTFEGSGLTLVEIVPPATADEVLTPPGEDPSDGGPLGPVPASSESYPGASTGSSLT